MRINVINKVTTSENVQSQSSSVPATPKLQAGVGSVPDQFETSAKQNALESAFGKLKQSVTDTNEDKKYYLEKLAEDNKAADAVSDYLAKLVEASEKIAEQEEGKDEDPVPVISQQATKGAAVKEAPKKEEDPFKLKIVR